MKYNIIDIEIYRFSIRPFQLENLVYVPSRRKKPGVGGLLGLKYNFRDIGTLMG
jgi:hypothetical protein